MSAELMYLAVIFLLTVALMTLFRRLCNRSLWLDVPNFRSAHDAPVPKGAGLVFLVVMEGFALFLYLQNEISHQLFVALLLAIPAGLLGLLDDFHSLSIRIRVISQIAIIATVLLIYGNPVRIPLPWGELQGVVVMLPVLLTFLWFFNLFNFMDGMDGLAACETVFIAAAALMLGASATVITSPELLSGLIVVLAGFLVFNTHPASLFMGDAGSNFLAIFLIVIVLDSQVHNTLSVWTWMILAGLFIADSTVTLAQRILDGQVWYHAHKLHMYQKLMQRLGSQARTLVLLMASNVFWLLPMAWLSEKYEWLGIVFMIVAYLPIIGLALFIRAGLQTPAKTG